MKTIYYNVQQTVKDYYGKGNFMGLNLCNDAHFLLLNFHRYTSKSQWTCSIESASVYKLEDAKEIIKQLEEEMPGDYSIVECPDNVKHNLRCCFA